MGLIAFLIIGALVGLFARAFVPGRQRLGLTATAALGVLGALAGGLLSARIAPHSSGLLFSLIGAIGVLALMGLVGRRLRA